MATKSHIFAIYDKQTEVFLSPILKTHPQQMYRDLQDSVNDPRSTFFNHSQHFELHYLQSLDLETGEFSFEEEIEQMLNLSHFKEE